MNYPILPDATLEHGGGAEGFSGLAARPLAKPSTALTLDGSHSSVVPFTWVVAPLAGVVAPLAGVVVGEPGLDRGRYVGDRGRADRLRVKRLVLVAVMVASGLSMASRARRHVSWRAASNAASNALDCGGTVRPPASRHAAVDLAGCASGSFRWLNLTAVKAAVNSVFANASLTFLRALAQSQL